MDRVSRARRGLAGVVAAMTLAACGTGGGGVAGSAESLEEMDPITLTVSDVNVESASNVQALEAWMDEVRDKTGGKVDFETHYSGVLHGGPEALDALDSGLTDITFSYAGFYPDKIPGSNWLLEFSDFAGEGFPNAIMANSPAIHAVHEESSDIRDELAEFNAVPLVVYGGGPYDLICTKPIETPGQAEGAIVTTSGEPWQSEAEALGMENTFIDLPERYEALQRGVTDCQLDTPSPLMNQGIWEVAKYYTPANFGTGLGVAYLINKDVWEGLPLEVQQIMHDAKATYLTEVVKLVTERYAVFAEEAPGKGVTFMDPSALDAVLDDEKAEGAETVTDRAPDSVSDPQAVVDRFRAEMDEWNGVVDELGVPKTEKTPENLKQVYQSARDVDWKGYHDRVATWLDQFRPE